MAGLLAKLRARSAGAKPANHANRANPKAGSSSDRPPISEISWISSAAERVGEVLPRRGTAATSAPSPRSRIEAAALRLGLPVADVLVQFDSWGYAPADIADMTDAIVEAHARLLASEFAEDRDAALLENIAERAAIIEESGAARTREEADRAAVRLVQCRTCLHYTPDRINLRTGIGECTVSGWAQSRTMAWPADTRTVPTYPGTLRYCRAHRRIH